MTFQQFFFILRARIKLVIGIFLAVVLTTLLVSLLLPKKYTANTALVIDVKSPDPVAGVILPGMISPGYMATQVDVIGSDRVAQRVVRLLKMDSNANVRNQWQETTQGRGSIEAWLGGLLQKNLDVKPSRESNVINIAYTAADPAFAAAVANAFVEAYIDVNLELKIEPARQSAAWFDEQLQRQREVLEKAQKTLSEHQQRTGLVNTDERLNLEINKLNDLSSALVTVEAQTVDSKSKGGQSNNLVEVMQNPLINGLKADIARLEAKLQESSLNLGKNHPQSLRMESELAALRERLQQETRQVSKTINTSYQVGRLKEQELRAAIEEQKKKILGLNQQRDELTVLKHDVENAQRAFDGISQRLTQTRLESLSIQTNIMPLNPAVEPLEPAKPRVLFNFLAACFLGPLFSVVGALLMELLQRRVRSQEDLLDALGLPVLAHIESAQAQNQSFEGCGNLRGWRTVFHSVLPKWRAS